MKSQFNLVIFLILFISSAAHSQSWTTKSTVVESNNDTYLLWFEGDDAIKFKNKFFGVLARTSWTAYDNFDFKKYDEYYNNTLNEVGTKNCKYYYSGELKGKFKCFTIIKL